MEVQIHGRGIKISERVEDYARRKLERLDRFLPNITDVRLELTREHTRRGEDLLVAQLTVRHARGAILRAEERGPGDDLQAIVSSAIDNMYRRIERFKGKRSRKGGSRYSERFTPTVEELEMAEEIPQEEYTTAPVADGFEPEIVRRKEISVTAMTEQEAVDQMELLGHTFFLFYDSATGSVNVLYKRTTGDYGVLVPILE